MDKKPRKDNPPPEKQKPKQTIGFPEEPYEFATPESDAPEHEQIRDPDPS